MKSAKPLTEEYIANNHIMQVATVNNGVPWICSVYYIHDQKLNLYWASIPSRRHSKEIEKCGDTSIAIVVQGDKGKKVIGIQAEGASTKLENYTDIQPIAKQYAAKFGRSAQWVEDFAKLKTEHRLYVFNPTSYVLFDEENFPDKPRIEIKL